MSQFNNNRSTPPKTGDAASGSEGLEIKPSQNTARNTDNDRAYGPGGSKVKDTASENSDKPAKSPSQVAEPGYEQQRAEPAMDAGGSDPISPDNTLL